MPSAIPKKSCLSSSASSSPCSSPSSTTATPPSPALYRGVHPTFVQPKIKKKVRFADPMCRIKSFTTTSYSKEIIVEEETPKRGKKRKEIRENVFHTEEVPDNSGPCPCNLYSCPFYGHYAHQQAHSAAGHPRPHKHHQHVPPHHLQDEDYHEPRPKTPAFDQRPERKEKMPRYKPSKVEMTIEFDIDEDDSFVSHLAPPTPTPPSRKRGTRQQHHHVAAPPPPPPPIQKFRPPSIDEFPDMPFYPPMPGMGNYWPYEPRASMVFPYYPEDQDYASAPQLRRKPRFNKLASQSSSSSMADSFESYDDRYHEPQPQQPQPRVRETRPRKSSNASSNGSSSGSHSSASKRYNAAEEQRRWEEDRRVEHLKRRERERRREREGRSGRVVLAGGLSGPYYQQRRALPAPPDRWEGDMI